MLPFLVGSRRLRLVKSRSWTSLVKRQCAICSMVSVILSCPPCLCLIVRGSEANSDPSWKWGFGRKWNIFFMLPETLTIAVIKIAEVWWSQRSLWFPSFVEWPCTRSYLHYELLTLEMDISFNRNSRTRSCSFSL